MSTVSQDNYVMEMQVRQKEWAKQKATYRERKRVRWGRITICTSVHSVLNIYFKRVCQSRE